MTPIQNSIRRAYLSLVVQHGVDPYQAARMAVQPFEGLLSPVQMGAMRAKLVEDHENEKSGTR
jgi:hypothetical protein